MLDPAPILRYLHIWMDEFTDGADSFHLPLPPSFLGNHTPLLTELVIRGPYIPWDSPLLQNNLVILKLIHYRHETSHLPDCDRFLTTLQCMTALEELELVKAVPTSLLSPSTEPLVSLPNLRRLRLASAPAKDILYLLNRISLPPPGHIHCLEIVDAVFDSQLNDIDPSQIIRKVFAQANPEVLPALQ
ncbi:hypothetical protein V5O48_015078, partial [Marasmius crinis-equi]